MARPNVQQLRGQSMDYQKTYMWGLSFPTGLPQAIASSPNFDADRVNLLCTSTELPTYEGETAQVMVKGYQILDPGIYKPRSRMTLTFLEMTDSPIRSFWDGWIAACRDKTTTFLGLACQAITLFSMDNQENQSYQYNLYWGFPDRTEPGEFGSDESNPMSFRVDLRYTDVRSGKTIASSDYFPNVANVPNA